MNINVWDIKEKKFHSGNSNLLIDLDGNIFGLNRELFLEILDQANFVKCFGSGVPDMNGKEIFQNDILEFTDKWEWYRSKYAVKFWFANEKETKKLQKQYDAEPMERRVISLPNDYDFLLSQEIQQYWKVIGNKLENPELVPETK